jgi:hypothetical protein
MRDGERLRGEVLAQRLLERPVELRDGLRRQARADPVCTFASDRAIAD